MLFNLDFSHVAIGDFSYLRDIARILRAGLIESGHDVNGFNQDLLPFPAVNLLIDRFRDAAAADQLIARKRQEGTRLTVGIVCTRDIEGGDTNAELVRRVLPIADFVWTVLPQVHECESVAGAGKVAKVELGFSRRLVPPRVIDVPELRDIDVAFIGRTTPHRAAILDRLNTEGFKCVTSGDEPLPAFVIDDLVRRAKIVLDLGRGDAGRFGSPVRMMAGLHAGAIVVSENRGVKIGRIADYVLNPGSGQVVDTVVAAVRSGMAVRLGLSALAKLQAEAPLQAGMAAALDLPALRSIAPDATRA